VGVDKNRSVDYNGLYTTNQGNPVTVSYFQQTDSRYRITLDITTLNDFNPSQIDWRKVLQLEPNESVQSYIENLTIPDSY